MMFGISVKSLPWWLSGKESACSSGASGHASSIPGLGRSSGREDGNPLRYSCLENPMDRGPRRATVHRVTVRHDSSEVAAAASVLKLNMFLKFN